MLKKITLLVIFLTILNSNPSYAQERASVGKIFKNFKFILHYGNLTGIGLGLNYFINESFSIDMLAGLEAPGYIIWPATYEENQWNINLKVKWATAISGFNVKAGVFLGSYDLNQIYDYYYISDSHDFWEIAPTLSFGYEYPKKILGKTYGIELGLAYNISKKYSQTEENQYVTYRIEAERSIQSMGNLYPFFIITITF